MSNTDRLVIWLHVAFVVFTIGPVSIAILSTPRYIRHRNVAVLRYLLRMTRIFGVASLGVLAFGIVAAQELKKLSSVWVTTAMTLFVVSLVLLVLIMRDQRKAVVALETSAEHEALATANHTGQQDADGHGDVPDAPDAEAIPLGSAPAAQAQVANVERGRIASMAGIVTLMWLVILVLMVWNS
jgi:choline-glycine betaine transporter